VLRSRVERAPRGFIVSLRYGLATGVILLLTRLARAQLQVPVLELDWHAPEGCPTAAEVQSEVMRLVGSNALPGRQLFVHAEAKNEGLAQWTLTLQTSIEDSVGERSLAGKSCRAVTDAAVLTLALTLNPELKLPESTLVPAETMPKDPNASGPWTERGAPQSVPNVPQRHQSKAEPLHGLVRTRVGLREAAVAKPYGEFGLGLGISYAQFHSWLLGSFTVDGNAHSFKSGAGAHFWEGSIASVNCYSFARGAFDVAPCLGLDWTRVRGDGYGFDRPAAGAIHWFSAVFGASLGWQLHPSGWLKLDGYGLVPLKRPTAFATPGRLEDLLQPQIVGAEVDFGVEWQIW